MASSTCSENETTIINVIEEIFAACDTENNGASKVSDLVNYITPFMEKNLETLVGLKDSLDPFNTDPIVTKEIFLKEMKNWVSKFNENEDSSEENSFKSPGQYKIEEKFLPYVQSTPRASFGNKLIRGYLEVSMLNTSITSQRSFCGTEAVEKTFFEEQINELLHQNKKCTDELLQVKLQLASVEEHNEVLQSDIRKLNKQLSHDRNIIENLESQQKTKEYEELREVTNNAQREMEKMQKIQHNTDKENKLLQEKISVLETEVVVYQEKVNRLHNTNIKHLEAMEQLKTELVEREKEAVQLNEHNTNLRISLNDQLKILENYEESNHCLKEERDKLQKVLHNKLKHNKSSHSYQSSLSEYNDSIKTTVLTPAQVFKSPIKTDKFKFFNYDSPVARISKHPPMNIGITEPKLSPLVMTPSRIPKSHTSNRKTILIFGEVPCGEASTPGRRSINPSELPHMGNAPQNTKTDTITNINPYQAFQTPKGDDEATDSPPCMYVVERSGSPRKSTSIRLSSSINNLNDLNMSNVSETVSEDDANWKLQLLSNRKSYSPHNSLRTELLQVGENISTNESHLLEYKDCTTNYVDVQVQVDNYDELEKLKNEYESTISMLNENYRKVDDAYNSIVIENTEQTLIKDQEIDSITNNYELQIATFKDDIVKLKEENTTLVNKIRETVLMYLHKLNDLENSMTAENTRNLLKENEIMNNLNELKIEYESKEKEFIKTIDFLKRQYTEIENKLVKISEECDENKRKKLKLEDENDKLNVMVFNFEDENSKLSNELKIIKADMEQKIAMFKTAAEEFENEICSLTTENEDLKIKYNQDLGESRNQLEMCRNCLADLEVKYLSSCGDVNTVKYENIELLRELETRDIKVKELNNLRSEYKDVLKKNEELEYYIDNLNKTNHNLVQNMKFFEDQVESLKRKVSVGSMTKQVKTNSHSKMMVKQEKLQTRIDYLEEQLERERQRTSMADKIKSTHTNVRSNFTLRVPTQILRPVSPDSPNLENVFQEDAKYNDNTDSSKPLYDFISIDHCSSTEPSTTTSDYSEEKEKDVNVSVYEDAMGLSRPMYILENLGHHCEDIMNPNLSDEELENLFTNIVLQFRLDSASIRNRYNTAFAKLNQEEMDMVTVIQEITTIIRKHFTGDFLKTAEIQMEKLLQHSMQTVRLGVHYGALTQEQDYLKTINVIINYVYLLKKKVLDMTERLSKCIKCQHQLVMIDNFVCPSETIMLPRSRKVRPSLTFIIGSVMFAILAYLHMDSHISDNLLQALEPHLSLHYPNGPRPK